MDALNITRQPPGVSRQLTTFQPDTRSKTVLLRPGDRKTITEAGGAGFITRLWLTFPGWFFQHWHPPARIDPTMLKSLIMRMYWDGADSPAVEAPVGDFFGAGQCEFNSFTSRFLGTSSGGFYSLWSMPFRKGFRIEFENRHPDQHTDLFLNVNYQELDELPGDASYLCTQFRTDRRQGPEEALILETKGRGHFAGMFLYMQGEPMHYLSFLEAPEYVSIDDDWDAPRMVGTGLEDYFNGGWYFRDGEFAGPHHGVPLKDPLRSMVTMYRFHEHDAIAFGRRIRFVFLNPWEPDRLKPYWYSSVAFWYGDSPSPKQPRLANHKKVMNLHRIRDTDHLSIP